ncbi:MAG: hypothetical protein IJX28_05500 [Clostridia bacterium]|nr:hypothetical protein [Clostridia bacterium]
MSKTKTVALSMVLVLLLPLLAGCAGNAYHAELYDLAVEWIDEEFAKEHPVRVLGASEEDDPNPKFRTFLVDSQDEYNEIFKDGQPSVDFNTQMLVIYTFSTEYHRENRITDLELADGVLRITYEMEKKYGVGDASMPYQRWFVVKLDKLEVSSVVFEERK